MVAGGCEFNPAAAEARGIGVEQLGSSGVVGVRRAAGGVAKTASDADCRSWGAGNVENWDAKM